MKEMTSKEKFEALRLALEEVDRRLASGELDGSGRYYTDEELAACMTTGKFVQPQVKEEATAA